MIGEPLWKSILFWLPREYLPFHIRRWLGIYTFSECFARGAGEGFSEGFRAGLRESGIDPDDFFGRVEDEQ